jgi:hypothetical protein
MDAYVRHLLEEWPEDLEGTVATQTAVAFLMTRVKCPDTAHCEKLGRVIKYLQGGPELGLMLEADDMDIIMWWMGASFAERHSNTKSSTEATLVGLNNMKPLILWTWYFLGAKEYDIKRKKIFQDNQSAVLLERKWWHSSSHRPDHINIRYFYVTDRVQSKELTMEYCPTGDMLASVFRKPLQGSLFHCPEALVCPATLRAPGHRSVLRNSHDRHEPHTDGVTCCRRKIYVAPSTQ